MHHFPSLATLTSRSLRIALIILHLPVIAFALTTHAVGGVLNHSHNFLVDVLNAASKAVQGTAHHLVQGVSSAVLDVRKVARGVGSTLDEMAKLDA